MSSGSHAAGPFCRRLYLHENHIERISREALASVELLPETPGRSASSVSSTSPSVSRKSMKRCRPTSWVAPSSPGNGLRRIIVNRDLAEQDDPVSRLRVRSTLAHEAGHGIFHNQLFIEKLERDAMTRLLDDGEGLFDSVSAEGFMCRAEAGMTEVPKFEWWEYQANLAMAALLLPHHLVVEAARGHLPKVLSGTGAFETRVAAAEREIASLFAVSRKMVSIRLGKWWHDQSRQPSLF